MVFAFVLLNMSMNVNQGENSTSSIPKAELDDGGSLCVTASSSCGSTSSSIKCEFFELINLLFFH